MPPRVSNTMNAITAGRLRDLGSITVVSAAVGLASTAQHWTGLDTPDSEFYATLGFFGDDVSDRGNPVYYWTRLGTIAPVRALTAALGPWLGYEIFRLILITAVVAATYLLARRWTRAITAAWLALLVSLNTVVLAWIGNPYVTGTVMALGFICVSATASVLTTSRRRTALIAGAVIGVGLGWMLMTSPYGLMLVCTICTSMTVVALLMQRNWRMILAAGLVGVPSVIVTIAAFLVVGRVIFPRMDWLATYLYWTSVINHADYIGDRWWFLHDTSMIVPAVIGLAALALACTQVNPRLRGSHTPGLLLAAVMVPASAAFALGYLLVVPSNTLEVGHYQSMQWIAALSALVIATAAAIGKRGLSRGTAAVMAVGVVVTIVLGHSTSGVELVVGWIIGVIVLGLWVTAGARLISDRPSTYAIVGFVVLTCAAFGAFQLLQNARTSSGAVAESPYSNAYNPNPVEAKVRTAHDAESWLISRTLSTDSVVVWVDADWHRDETLLPMAAFQLWGANQITADRFLSGVDLERARTVRPSVLAMYGRTLAANLEFWKALPAGIRKTDPECSDYPWPDASTPTAYVCLTHLVWTE